MLYKITLSGKDYWYDPEFGGQLYEDEAGTIIVKTKFMEDYDLHEYLRQSEVIRKAFLLSRQ